MVFIFTLGLAWRGHLVANVFIQAGIFRCGVIEGVSDQQMLCLCNCLGVTSL